jgi:hypothetical protein
MHMRGLRPSVEDRRKTTSLRQMQNTVLGSKIEMSDFSIYEVIRRRELSRERHRRSYYAKIAASVGIARNHWRPAAPRAA